MTPPDSASQARAEARLRRELAALAYLDALEADDLDTIALLWEQATDDAELAQILCDLSAGLMEEEEPSPGWDMDAAKVEDLLKLHFPSGAPALPAGPLTAGDVAARIAGDDRLLAKLTVEERSANALLLADRTPLPSQLGVDSLQSWAAALPVLASQGYWTIFRHAAVLMTMGRSHQAGLLMAARRNAPAPPPEKPDKPAEGGAS